MNTRFFKFTSMLASACIIFSACNDDQPKPLPTPTPDSSTYMDGVLVVCEGNFSNNDGAISFISDTLVKTNVFETVNNNPLGDIVQSYTVIDSTGYIVVNNSQKIEVVNAATFTRIGTIKNLSFPRYVVKVSDNTIAVSNGDGYENNYVYFFNTNTLQKIDSVATGAGPNKMAVVNNKLYVANMGGYSNDSTISVIDVQTRTVTNTITVGDLPADIEVDENGNIFVLCIGLTTYDASWNPQVLSNSKLVKISNTTHTVSTLINFEYQVSNFSSNGLAYHNGTIYYLHDGVYSLTQSNTQATKIIDGYFYGIDINPKNNTIWVTKTSSTDSHKAIQYSSNGTKINEYVTGFYPNAVIF